MDQIPRTYLPPIASEKISSDRKLFFIDLHENARGRFVKITEDVKGRRDTIMIPTEVLSEFCEKLSSIRTYESTLSEGSQA